MKRGDFVIYKPEVGPEEYGIVTSVNKENNTAHVRYIRTLANSECTNIEDLEIPETQEGWLSQLEGYLIGRFKNLL